MNEWFDILPLDHSSVSAACVSAYTVPQDGRLLVTASLRNFYSRVTLALRDEWGFSSAARLPRGRRAGRDLDLASDHRELRELKFRRRRRR